MTSCRCSQQTLMDRKASKIFRGWFGAPAAGVQQISPRCWGKRPRNESTSGACAVVGGWHRGERRRRCKAVYSESRNPRPASEREQAI